MDKESSRKYRVEFGVEPRTIVYHDGMGAMRFDFTLHRGGYGRYERWLLDLQPRMASATSNDPLPDPHRMAVIVRRVEEFAIAHGYWLLPAN